MSDLPEDPNEFDGRPGLSADQSTASEPDAVLGERALNGNKLAAAVLFTGALGLVAGDGGPHDPQVAEHRLDEVPDGRHTPAVLPNGKAIKIDTGELYTTGVVEIATVSGSSETGGR